MPKFSVWAMRASLLYLLLGFTFGALLLANKGIPISPALWSLLPLHIEFLLLGWVVQLVFAVAYWIFPRFRLAPKRGPKPLAWTALALLNAGILLAASSAWLAFPAGFLIGRIGEMAAVVLFTLALWGRVKATETGPQP